MSKKTDLVSKPQISVIVPVYQVAPYLNRCLDSLSVQVFSDVEFLLIDDGSPDHCGEICEKYAEKDARFHVFHKENGGVSSARNYGVDRARGKYLMFVDSDDWVSPDFCSTAYALAEQMGADLVMFAYQRVKGKRYLSSRFRKQKEGYKTPEEAVDLLLGRIGNYVWNKLYRRELFDGIRFPEGQLFEDVATTYQLVYKTEKIYFTNRILYYYFKRDNSIIHRMTAKSLRNMFDMTMSQHEGLKRNAYPEEKAELLLKNTAMSYAIMMKQDGENELSVWSRNTLNSIKKVPKGFSFKRKVLFFLYRINTRLFDLCCILWNQRLK